MFITILYEKYNRAEYRNFLSQCQSILQRDFLEIHYLQNSQVEEVAFAFPEKFERARVS